MTDSLKRRRKDESLQAFIARTDSFAGQYWQYSAGCDCRPCVRYRKARRWKAIKR